MNKDAEMFGKSVETDVRFLSDLLNDTAKAIVKRKLDGTDVHIYFSTNIAKHMGSQFNPTPLRTCLHNIDVSQMNVLRWNLLKDSLQEKVSVFLHDGMSTSELINRAALLLEQRITQLEGSSSSSWMRIKSDIEKLTPKASRQDVDVIFSKIKYFSELVDSNLDHLVPKQEALRLMIQMAEKLGIRHIVRTIIQMDKDKNDVLNYYDIILQHIEEQEFLRLMEKQDLTQRPMEQSQLGGDHGKQSADMIIEHPVFYSDRKHYGKARTMRGRQERFKEYKKRPMQGDIQRPDYGQKKEWKWSNHHHHPNHQRREDERRFRQGYSRNNWKNNWPKKKKIHLVQHQAEDQTEMSESMDDENEQNDERRVFTILTVSKETDKWLHQDATQGDEQQETTHHEERSYATPKMEILVDSGAEVPIFNSTFEPFLSNFERTKDILTGIGGELENATSCELRCELADINGEIQKLTIKGYYVPELPISVIPGSKSVLDTNCKPTYVVINGKYIATVGKYIEPKPLIPKNQSMGTTSPTTTKDIWYNNTLGFSQEDSFLLATYIHKALLHVNVKYLHEAFRYYKINIPKTIAEEVSKNCLLCRKNENFTTHPETKLKALPCSIDAKVRVGEVIHVDTFFMRDGSEDGSPLKPYLLMRDRASNYIYIKCLPSKDTIHTSEAIMELVSFLRRCQHKVSTVFTDNGSEFSELFHEYLSKEGIQHLKSAPYSPQQNGAAERSIQTIKRKLKFVQQELGLKAPQINVLLMASAQAHNMTPRNGKTPHELVLKSKPILWLAPLSPVSFRIQQSNAVQTYLGLNIARQNGNFIVLNYERGMTQIVPRFNLKFLVRSPLLAVEYMRKLRNGDHNSAVDSIYKNIGNLFETFIVQGPLLIQHGLNEDTNPPISDQDQIDDAIRQELAQFASLKVLGAECLAENPITTRFVITKKNGSYKARLVLRGFQENGEIDGTVALPSVPVRSLTFVYALSRNLHLFIGDIRTAFLHVPAIRKICIKMPGHIPANDFGIRPHKCYELLKHAYGLKDASKQFVLHLKAILEKLNFEFVSPGLFKRGSDIVCTYVDDLIIASKSPDKLIKQLTESISIKEFKRISEQETRFLGCNIAKVGDEIKKSTIYKQEQIPKPNYNWNKEKINKHLETLRKDATEKRTTSEKVKENQTISGILTWRALQSPHVAYPASLCASLAHHVDNATQDLLRHLFHKTYNDSVIYKRIEKPRLSIFTDAAYHRKLRTGHFGYLFFLHENENELMNPILWTSKKDERYMMSTATAELVPIIEALIQCQFLVPVLFQLFGRDIPICLYTDSNIVLHQLKSPFNARENPFELQFCRQLILEFNVAISFVESSDNPADMLTKLMDTDNSSIW